MNANRRKRWQLGAIGASALVVSGAIGYASLNAGSAETGVAFTNTDDIEQVAPTTPQPGRPPFGGRGGRGGENHHLQGMDTNPAEVELAPAQSEVEATQSTERVEGAQYYDGQYYGDAVNAGRWGTLQVVAVIEEGELVNVLIADYPRSTYESDIITRNALPTLISAAIEAQDAEIDFVSRATDSSRAFVASLESALLDATIGIDL